MTCSEHDRRLRDLPFRYRARHHPQPLGAADGARLAVLDQLEAWIDEVAASLA